MPVADRKAQVLGQGLSHHLLFWIVPSVRERFATGRTLIGDGLVERKKSLMKTDSP